MNENKSNFLAWKVLRKLMWHEFKKIKLVGVNNFGFSIKCRAENIYWNFIIAKFWRNENDYFYFHSSKTLENQEKSNKNDVMTYFQAQMSIHYRIVFEILQKSHKICRCLYAKRHVKCQKTTNCMRKKHTRKITINLSKSIVLILFWTDTYLLV